MSYKVLVKEKGIHLCDICEKEVKEAPSKYYEWPLGDWNGYGRSITGFRLIVQVDRFCAISDTSREGRKLEDICSDCLQKALRDMASDKEHSWMK